MDSAFKVPLALKRTTESLLFNDILEEKTVALRDRLNEFLQVQPYHKFNDEFVTFMERTGRIIQESQRAGTNVSRLTNCSHIQPYSGPSASFNYRPTASFNYRPSTTTVSMVSSKVGSAFRLPENNYQPIEPNPFKPPGNINYEPQVVLPRIDSSIYHSSHVTPSSCATVIEVGQENVQVNDNRENVQSPDPKKNSQSTVVNSYSDMTVIENKVDSNSRHGESHSIDELLESVGFKIVIGVPDTNNTKNSQKSNASVQNNNNKLNKTENIEKFLSMWSVNMKHIKSNIKTSKYVVILSGDLMGEDKVTVVEKHHNAGILESRKENSLVKTKNGIYRLIGNVVSGLPNNLYNACLTNNGIPRTWKSLVRQLAGVERGPKNALLNFSLDSPAGPSSKPIKCSINLDISKTRRGTSYGENRSIDVQKLYGKRKLTDSDINDIKKNFNKHRKLYEQLSPMMSSTPKRPSKPLNTMFETPSQILKNKFHQSMCNANSKPSLKSKNRVLQTINDSINITKKRRSYSKEQTENLKKETLLKPTETTCNSSRHSNMSSNNSSKQSKPLKNSNSKILNSVNSSSTKSKRNTIENSTDATNSNSSRQQSKLHKSSINSTKSSVNSTQKSGQVTGKTQNIAKVEKSGPSIDFTNTKQNTSNRVSLSITKPKVVSNYKNGNNKKAMVKEKNCIKLLNNKAKPKESKNGNKPGPNTYLGLFEDLDVAEFDNNTSYDFNILASPGKLNSILHTDKSRSETPPLFNNPLSVTAKSLVTSEPPSPLSKSVEAKVLKRIKAPKLNVQEELKKNKRKMNKQSVDYKAVSNKINKMLEFGEQYNEDDN